MKQRSIQVMVILPIFLGIFFTFLLTILITERLTSNFSKEYASGRLEAEARELEVLISDKEKTPPAISSIPFSTGSIIEQTEFLPFAILSEKGASVFNIDSTTLQKLKSLDFTDSPLQVLETDSRIRYFVFKRMTNKTAIYVMMKEQDIPGLRSLVLMKEAVAGSGLLILLLIAIILRVNLARPVKSLITDLKSGSPLRESGISELDQLALAVNTAIEEIEKRSVRYMMLHRIAVELNTITDLRSVLKNILDYSREILEARYAALAIYDETGKFSDLIVSGVSTAPAIMPEGKGILQFMKLSLTPVRISDIKTHPAFSGTLPEGHPDITSFLGYPVFLRDGRPAGAIYFANKLGGDFTLEDESILKAISSDIAVAIQREHILEELRRFKRIIDNAFDVIVITDIEGTIVYVNSAFEKVTGYRRDEALGKNPRILKSGLHEAEFYRNLWQRILGGEPWRGEFINRKKSGELYNADASIFPLLDSTGRITHFVSIQRDITEEKKLYENLLRAQKMEAIGTLASGIAHDFNNILTSILGYAELLKYEFSEGSELHRYADIIEKSAMRGADLAKKILTVTKKEHAEFRPVNLNNVIKETVEILMKSIPREIMIELKLKEGLPYIKADYSQMSQVIMNLAINARDAMPEGGRLLIATDIVGGENGAANGMAPLRGINFVKLTVEDTGAGIPKEFQSKIFDPFFTTKEPGRGTGLGLYIVHSIITNHGGYINLYSEPGKGTRFNIYLPVYVEEGPTSIQEETVDEFITGTILVIDDEQYICDLYKDILTRAGFRVFTATEPLEGIKIFKENRIDAVILDLIMPKMSGREVFQILKGLDKEERPEIILSSGYSAELYSDINSMLSSGAKTFIQKPVSPKTLLLTLRRILKER